jgi:hypothetical protein
MRVFFHFEKTRGFSKKKNRLIDVLSPPSTVNPRNRVIRENFQKIHRKTLERRSCFFDGQNTKEVPTKISKMGWKLRTVSRKNFII